MVYNGRDIAGKENVGEQSYGMLAHIPEPQEQCASVSLMTDSYP